MIDCTGKLPESNDQICKINSIYPVFGQKSNSFIIVLLCSHQEQHDDKDWCFSPLQDQALQEVQHQWLLPIRHEMPVHSRHGGGSTTRGRSTINIGTTSLYQVNYNFNHHHWYPSSTREESSWRLWKQASFCCFCSHQSHLQRYSSS